MKNQMLSLPAESIPVFAETDLCVIGGSCTGVFAAIRAARSGARVVLIEQSGRFGGVATLGLVGMWHTFFDTGKQQQIIAGLTREACLELDKANAVSNFRDPDQSEKGIRFNPEQLTLVLDRMVGAEKNITVFLHTAFSNVVMKGPGEIDCAVFQGRGERFAIRAKYFIDATGEGFVCRAAGSEMYRHHREQPATTCAVFQDWPSGIDLKKLVEANHAAEPELPCGYYWGMDIPGTSAFMLAGTRILNGGTLDTCAITRAELESRTQVGALDRVLRAAYPERKLGLLSLPAMIGIRDGLHISSLTPLTGEKLLSGAVCPDAIANGTYPVDIHSPDSDQIMFRRLNGEETLYAANQLLSKRRWLPDGEFLPYYQIPLGSLIPRNAVNFIAAGRMIDADESAFGAIRVMVNLNQCGEAAGIAATCALDHSIKIAKVSSAEVRTCLAAGGSIVL